MTSAPLRRMEIEVEERSDTDGGPDGWGYSVADYVRIEEESEDPLAQTNPLVVFEVASKSSERYDRGKKR